MREPHVEYIAEVAFWTDGDWKYSEELGYLYHNNMEEDGGFEGRIRFFDDVLETWEYLTEVAKCAGSGGLSRSRSFDSDQWYLDGIHNIYDALSNPIVRDDIKNWSDNMSEDESGGLRLHTECGNWSSMFSLYCRVNGRIGEVRDIGFSNMPE